MTSLRAISGDITTQVVDAIVNAANSGLTGGGGVDGAIHRAGGPVIDRQCRAWAQAHGRLATGEAMITEAGDMPARHVIHTVGPVWGERAPEESRRLLSNCYRNSLDLALDNDLSTLAFPNISTGVYRYPKRQAGEVAVDGVRRWVVANNGIDEIIFVCFDEENLGVYSELLDS